MAGGGRGDRAARSPTGASLGARLSQAATKLKTRRPAGEMCAVCWLSCKRAERKLVGGIITCQQERNGRKAELDLRWIAFFRAPGTDPSLGTSAHLQERDSTSRQARSMPAWARGLASDRHVMGKGRYRRRATAHRALLQSDRESVAPVAVRIRERRLTVLWTALCSSQAQLASSRDLPWLTATRQLMDDEVSRDVGCATLKLLLR